MKSIDLHMHTKHSDGAYKLKEVLEQANQKQLKTISITDHSIIDAYYELFDNNFYNIYNKKIIFGVEIYSYFDNNVIEFLVYDFDMIKMKQYLDKHYGKQWSNNRIDYVLTRLKKVAREAGLKFDEDFNLGERLVGESFLFFQHLISFEENHHYFDNDLLTRKRSFFRTEVCNMNSPFYVDYSQFYLKPETLIKFVKKHGGKIFLAHVYRYTLADHTKLLDYSRKLGVDGIEVFYPSFTYEQTKFLISYCKKHNLLMSGGSDYHGNNPLKLLGEISPNYIIHKNYFAWVDQIKNINTNVQVNSYPNTIKTPVTSLTVNTIVISDNDNVIIVDPSLNIQEIKKIVGNKRVIGVLLTHAHWDHILTLNKVLTTYNCLLYLSKKCLPKFKDARLNCSFDHELNYTFEIPKNTKIIFLKGKEGILNLNDFEIKYYYTPGHSDDSYSFIINNKLITGDTLRLHKLARTDLPKSNPKQLQKTIQFYYTLPNILTVYSGHEIPHKLKDNFIYQT